MYSKAARKMQAIDFIFPNVSPKKTWTNNPKLQFVAQDHWRVNQSNDVKIHWADAGLIVYFTENTFVGK